jgi:hypothetical protein
MPAFFGMSDRRCFLPAAEKGSLSDISSSVGQAGFLNFAALVQAMPEAGCIFRLKGRINKPVS